MSVMATYAVMDAADRLVARTFEQTEISVAAAGNTATSDLLLQGRFAAVSFDLDNTVQALDACKVEAKMHPNGEWFDWVTSAELNTGTAIAGRLIAVVSNPTTLAAGSKARFVIASSALYGVRLQVSAAVSSAVLTVRGTAVENVAASSSGSGGGAGDFVGPGSSTDNAVVRFDGATGKLGQNSGVIIDDSNNVTGVAGHVSTSLTDSGLTSGRFTFAGTGGLLADDAAFTQAASAATMTFANVGLKVLDTNASHVLSIVPGSDITANRTLTLTTGDASRTLTLSADVTLNQSVATTSGPTFANVTDSALTSGRFVLGSTAGLLADDAAFTFASSAATMTFANVGLKVLDTDASNTLNFKWNSNDSSNRTLSFVMTADRTLTISGNATLNQDVSTTASANFANVTLTSNLELDASNGSSTAVQYGQRFYCKSPGPATVTNIIGSAPGSRYQAEGWNGSATETANLYTAFFTSSGATPLTGNFGFVFSSGLPGTVPSFVMRGDGALGICDTDVSNLLYIKAGSNLTADRAFTLTTGDAARTLTMNGNATLDQPVDTTASPTFVATTNVVAGIAVTSTDGNVISNTTAATAGTLQWSPRMRLRGNAWDTTTVATRTVDVKLEIQTASAATVSSAGNVVMAYSINGGAYNNVFSCNILPGTQTITFPNGGTFGGTLTALTLISNSFQNSAASASFIRAGIATTPTAAIIINNTTAATNGVPQQISPWVQWIGHAWTGAADRTLDFRCYCIPVNGANPLTGDLWFLTSENAGTATNVCKIKSTGAFGIADTDASHFLVLTAGSNLTADRALTITTGDAARTLTLNGNATLDQAVDTTGSPAFVNCSLTGTTGLTISTAGGGVLVKEGTNATMGVATLVAGSVVVSTTKVTANSRIFLEVQSLGTVAVPTMIGITARTAGTSFTITSANVADTSVIAWVILEPA